MASGSVIAIAMMMASNVTRRWVHSSGQRWLPPTCTPPPTDSRECSR
jgi:hypothetical protein